MRLTDRDMAILDVVSRHRFLTTSLIFSLVSGSRQNITRRLQRLYHNGFLDRPKAQLPLRYSGELSEFVYCPTRKGDAGRGQKPVTSLFLAHALLVSEVLIRVELDCRATGARFIPEDEILKSITVDSSPRRIQWRVTLKVGSWKERIGVIPDAAFAIEHPSFEGTRRRYFFLEADRGTMPIRRKSLRFSSIQRKALAYARSRKGCVLKDRFGVPGFQVLFVSQSEKRLGRIQKAFCGRAHGIFRSLFIFRTHDAFKSEHSPMNFPPLQLEKTT